MTVSFSLHRLACWMAGHFNNFDQAITDPIWFANIHVYQYPLPVEVLGGLSLYLEQAYDIYPEHPYRQRVNLLREENSQITLHTYDVKRPEYWAGSAKNPSKLQSMTQDDLEVMPGCISTIEWTGSSYKGKGIPGKSCIVMRKEQVTYLRNEFELTENTLESLDQGLDPETDKVVWGSLCGPFQFVKKEDFSMYVPNP
jgi:hypothetical protein